MKAPQNQVDYLKFIAIETARTAWPGSMMRGEKQVLRKGAKQATEGFFRDKFPMQDLWMSADSIGKEFDGWHRKVCADLAEVIGPLMGAKRNTKDAVAAKLMDTFMHQQMKMEPVRVLWPSLHLPLDRRVFDALAKRHIKFVGKERIVEILKKPPYSISREEYEKIQQSLWGLLETMPQSSEGGPRWKSRIELNWLWVGQI